MKILIPINSRLILKICFVGLFLHAITIESSAQSSDTTIELKQQIELLTAASDIMAVNRLLNRNTTLEPEYTLAIIQRNIELAKQHNNLETLAYTWLTQGNFWLMRSNKIKAYECFYTSETISRSHNFDQITALAVMNRSHLEPDNEIKKEMLREAIALFERNGDQVNLAKAYLNLGQAYSSVIFLDSVSILIVPNSTSSNQHDRATMLKTTRDAAFSNYYIAAEINDSISHPEIEASVHVHFAEWYKFEKDYQKAEEHFKLASEFFVKAGQLKGHIYSQMQLASIKSLKSDYENALGILEDLADLSEKYSYYDYLVDIYLGLVTIYDSLGNHKLALDNHRRYTQSLNELNEIISKDKIHNLSLENKLLEQNSLITSLNHRKKTNRLIILFVIVALVLILVSAYLVVMNKRKKIELITKEVEKSKRLNVLQQKLIESNKAKQELQKELLEEKVRLKSERIVMIANQMNKIDMFLQSIDGEMKAMLEHSGDSSLKEKINALKISLSQGMNVQTNLKELTALASETNQNFFQYIEQNFQHITKDDLKLLSFLILNMSSKEIAQQLNIADESVHKKRYRLRQKLKIESGKSFDDFYKEKLAEINH